MAALSQTYQTERPDLEKANLTPWVIRALCHYVTHVTSATMRVSSQQEDEWQFPTKEINQVVAVLLQDEESGLDLTKISTDRIGRILGTLRLRKKERIKANDPRTWCLTKEELRRFLVSYGMPLPPTIFPQQPPAATSGTSGTTSNLLNVAPPDPSGTSGTSGIVAQPDDDCDEGVVP